MLLSITAKVKISTKNAKRFESLGYNIPMRKASKSTKIHTGKDYVYDYGKFIIVKVEDLSPQSKALVYVQCDVCGRKYVLCYCDYIKNIQNQGYVACSSKCSKQKAMVTSTKKYGVPIPQQSQEVKDRAKQTCLERYGLESSNQDINVKNKKLQSYISRYGVSNPYFIPGTEEKRRSTMIEKYGYDNPSKSEEIQEKKRMRYYINGTVPTSSQQYAIYEFYSAIYPQTKLNYPIAKRYSGDIVIDNIDYEVDYGGHNLRVKLGQVTQEEFNRSQIIRDSSVKYDGYKIIRLIAEKERKIPSDETLLDILNVSKQYFKDYPNHSWIEWYVEKGYYSNAENKDGIPYDFGTLRKIKKADLPEEDQNQETQAA